jgi:hypothetical protein
MGSCCKFEIAGSLFDYYINVYMYLYNRPASILDVPVLGLPLKCQYRQ